MRDLGVLGHGARRCWARCVSYIRVRTTSPEAPVNAATVQIATDIPRGVGDHAGQVGIVVSHKVSIG